MEYNKKIKNTWLVVSLVTALAFAISGLVQLRLEQLVWPSVMKFASALALLLFSITIAIKAKRIFANPAFYVMFYFAGYILVFVGMMTTINKVFWSLGIFCLLFPLYMAFRSKKTSDTEPEQM